MEIEVFRAGNAAANAAGITAADLAAIASSYDGSNPAPCVIGHPTTDSPAAGAIKTFRAAGNSLYADITDDAPAFAPVKAGVKDKSILGRSMAFFGPSHPSNPTPGKFAPKHLGFLGGAAVGIPGMPALESYFKAHPEQTLCFSADDALEITGDPAPAMIFEAAPTAVFTFTEAAEPGETKETTVTEAEKLAADRAAFEAERTAHAEQIKQFAADRKAATEAANTATVKGLVTASKVLPADEPDLIAAFNAISDAEVIEFASDKVKASPVSRIAAIMAKGGAVTPAGQERFSSSEQAPEFAADSKKVADLETVRAERMSKYGK